MIARVRKILTEDYSVELHILLIFMIIAAIVAIEVKDLLSSVIAVGAVGLGLSLAFLILKAPDLAITQLVVEILCLIILIRATIKRDLPLIRDGRWLFNSFSTLLFIAFFLGTSSYMIPLVFVSYLNKNERIKQIGIMLALLSSIWFLFTGIAGLMR